MSMRDSLKMMKKEGKIKNAFDFKGEKENLIFGREHTAEGESSIHIYTEIDGESGSERYVAYNEGDILDFSNPQYFSIMLCGEPYSAGPNSSSPHEVAGKIILITEDYQGAPRNFARIGYRIAE